MNVKFSILVVLLGVALSSAFVCPKINRANDFHPHETDNSKYYSCTRGVATEETCANSLIFSKMTNKCTTVWTDAPISAGSRSIDSTTVSDLDPYY
ncbi:AAEL002492-PA [Aedes aegypti]|uniref:AAEL002492-PA n=1 Tax=Aedes aegypti TaxID=7159 RepID=Q17I32_AEDAE|nr:AAEL002492-PA [Aedes aegypti]